MEVFTQCTTRVMEIYLFSEGYLEIYPPKFYFICQFKGFFQKLSSNACCQIGLNIHISNVCKPTLMMKDEEVKQVSTGYAHSIILRKNGDLVIFGDGRIGQLGNGDLKICSPRVLLNDKQIVAIRCGQNHSTFLKSDGSVYSFGQVCIVKKSFFCILKEYVEELQWTAWRRTQFIPITSGICVERSSYKHFHEWNKKEGRVVPIKPLILSPRIQDVCVCFRFVSFENETRRKKQNRSSKVDSLPNHKQHGVQSSNKNTS